MLDNQRYTTESEFVSCSFCGTTVSTALTVCPTCGNDIRPQRRLQISWSTASFFILIALLALWVGLSGEGSTLRRTLQSSLARLDQLANDLDPRLAATTTPAAQTLLLPLATADGNAAVASAQSVGEPAVTEVSLLPTDTPDPESLANAAATAIPLIESETATPLPTQSPTTAATDTPAATHTATAAATATKAPATPTVTATTRSIAASNAVTVAGQISPSVALSSLLAATTTPAVVFSTPLITASASVSATGTISDVLSLLAPTATRTPAAPTLAPPTPAAPILTDTPAPTVTLAPLIYEVQSGDTLIVIASRYNIALEELLAANGVSNGRTPVIRPGQKLVIPNQFAPPVPAEAMALAATATLEPPTALPTATEVSATATGLPATATATPITAPTNLTYVIKSGDTPSSIARRFGVSVNLLLAANGLTLGDATSIRPGQIWVIPGVPVAGATAAAELTYIVQSGDTPMAIANRYGVSVDALLTANGLTRADATRIRPGQSLIIPGAQAIVAAPSPSPTPVPATATAVVAQTYIVQSGDTPLTIANRYGISVDALLAANRLSRADATRLRTGQSLIIPGGQASEPTATRSTPTQVASATTVENTNSTQNSSPGTVRLDAPQLVSPENGTAVSCSSEHWLVWNAVSFMRDSDRYMVHLGYVGGRDSAGVPITTWVLSQERLPSDPQWQLDNNLCSFTPDGFERQWRWYVEVIDTTAGNAVVSAPAAVYTFRWE